MYREQAGLEVNHDLEAQYALMEHLTNRIIDSSRISGPEVDDESFGYASQIFVETKRNIARLEHRQPLGTGNQLREYAERQQESDGITSTLDSWQADITELLAARLDGSLDGVVPQGFVMASHLLRYDLQSTGTNGFTGEPMPQHLVGLPPAVYGAFFDMDALVDMARGAFGDDFADEVRAFSDKVNDKLPAGPKLTESEADKLGSVEDSIDPHQAAARWWAHAVLRPKFDMGARPDDEVCIDGEAMVTIASRKARPEIESRIGEFAAALERISRENDLDCIGVDYNPDIVLRRAAEEAKMPFNDMTTFPWKSHTWIQDGKVLAAKGYGAQAKQVWPPAEETAA